MKKVEARKHQQVIPTYVHKKPNELPMFFEKKPYQGASGHLYPLPFSDGITDVKQDVSYETYTLENEYVKTQVLPELGGKILRGYDKVGEHDFIYYNEVVKPALVGIAGAWISGGIEFNWPQHHRPTTMLPLEATLEENSDGSKTVWTGEVDPLYRMKGMAGITVDPGRSYIKAKIRVYNRTAVPQVFMWWANLAVPVNKNYQTIFPPDVEWVNDHDRRAVLSWPVAKGVYKTARPFNYGEGTDISWYDKVKLPSSFMISQGQSDMDFVAGYDHGIQKGIATIANHHIAPGKKLWTWGLGEFGDMWCSNLSDENGPYVELMTGAYTDNQPDFTWLAPYETREFEQYWYPIRDMGGVTNATVDAAMNMEKRGEELYAAFLATGTFTGAVITVRDGDEVLYTETVDLTPEVTWKKNLPLAGHAYENLTVCLRSAEGKVLVSYKPYKRGQKQPIEPRQPVRRPCEYETVEELFINGFHLEQYKQHNYDPRDYYGEGVKRDPGDIRCNTGLGRLALKDGKFEEAIGYFDTAIARMTSRNQHPQDTEALYLKGLALRYLGREDEAYDILYRAAWSYNYRASAYYQLACLDVKKGEYCDALVKLEESLGLTRGHTRAITLKCAILRKLGRMEEAAALSRAAVKDDLLDLWARFELSACTGDTAELQEIFGGKVENFLNVVGDYLEAGLVEDALRVLDCAGEDPMVRYYRAYCLKLQGKAFEAELEAAAQLPTGLCFPARLEDIAVLKLAVENPADANACYFLGSLYYDRFRYEEAIALWEQAIERNPVHGKALRNLGLAYYDKRGDWTAARVCMERALAVMKDPRLFYEYQQLLKNSNVEPEKRLAVYAENPELLDLRDDCYLDRMVLLSQLGRSKEAIEAARNRHFHTYEGGEGNLTRQHGWMHVLYGNQLAAEGKWEEAMAVYRAGTVIPKSYGEAKTHFNQEGHLYYYLGLLLEKQGLTEQAMEAFENASVYKAAISDISLFRALALRKLGRFTEAKAVLDDMVAEGDRLLANKDMRGYYGVGSPTPMPFEYDIVKVNTVNGQLLRAYGLLGLGRLQEAEGAVSEAAKLDPWNFRIYAFEQVKG